MNTKMTKRELQEAISAGVDAAMYRMIAGDSIAAPVWDPKARAQIILTVLDDGRLLLKGYRFGRWNTTYANGEDSVLAEIPKLLAELREETAAYYPAIPRKTGAL